MFFESLQGGFTCDERIASVQIDKEERAQAWNQNGPQQSHAIVGTCFGHGRHTSRAEVETQ